MLNEENSKRKTMHRQKRDKLTNVVDIQKPVQTAWEKELLDSSDLQIRRLLRPVFVFLALTGNFSATDVFNVDKDQHQSALQKLIKVVLVIYRLLVLTIIIASLCRIIVGFVVLDPTHWTNSITHLVWCCDCIMNVVFMTKMGHKKYGCLHKFMKLWDDKIVPAFSEMAIEFDGKCFRKKQYAVIFLASSVIIMNTVGVISLASGTISPKMAVFYMAPFSGNNLIMVFHAVSMVSLAMVWFGPMVIQLTNCILVRNVFRSYVKRWEESIKTTTRIKIPGECTRFRHLHLDICKLVEELDGDFSLFYAVLFVTGMFISCFCLYYLLNGDSDIINLVMNVFWLSLILSMVVILFGFAAYVHEAAHSPLDSIYYLDVVGIDVASSAQLNLFLSKLTGTQVGFTTLGLLTITKEFLLTILGVFLTYFFLLYSL